MMPCCPHLRRFLAVLATAAVLGAVLLLVFLSGRPGDAGGAPADPPQAAAPSSWPMFGGTLQRNLVNLTDRNIPTEFSVEEGKFQNIKWAVDLGSKAYGGPIIAGARTRLAGSLAGFTAGERRS